MSDEPGCYGNTAEGGYLVEHGCRRPPRFHVSLEERRGGTPTASVGFRGYSCGRHLSWLVSHVTVSGRTVQVTRL